MVSLQLVPKHIPFSAKKLCNVLSYHQTVLAIHNLGILRWETFSRVHTTSTRTIEMGSNERTCVVELGNHRTYVHPPNRSHCYTFLPLSISKCHVMTYVMLSHSACNAHTSIHSRISYLDSYDIWGLCYSQFLIFWYTCECVTIPYLYDEITTTYRVLDNFFSPQKNIHFILQKCNVMVTHILLTWMNG